MQPSETQSTRHYPKTLERLHSCQWRLLVNFSAFAAIQSQYSSLQAVVFVSVWSYIELASIPFSDLSTLLLCGRLRLAELAKLNLAIIIIMATITKLARAYEPAAAREVMMTSAGRFSRSTSRRHSLILLVLAYVTMTGREEQRRKEGKVALSPPISFIHLFISVTSGL